MDIKSAIITINAKINKAFDRLSYRGYLLLLGFHIVSQLLIYNGNIVNLNESEWQTKELTMNYTYGFIRRGFLGSITYFVSNLFSIEYAASIKIIQAAGLILFTVSLLLFFRKLLKDGKDKTGIFFIFLMIALNIWGTQFNRYGLFDTYMICLTLIAVYLIIKNKALFFVPILTGICVLIHEGYPMMYFGIIAALFIYRYCYAGSKKEKIKFAVYFIVTGLVVSVLFIYFYIIQPRIINPDIEAILATCKSYLKRDDLDVGNIRYIWLDPEFHPDSFFCLCVMWMNGKPTDLFYSKMNLVILNTIVCLPLIVLTSRFWISIIKNEASKFKKALIVFCSLLVFLVLPLIIMHTDQVRWFHDIVFFETITIGSICILNFNKELDVLAKYTKISIAKILLFICYTVLYFPCYFYTITEYFIPFVPMIVPC